MTSFAIAAPSVWVRRPRCNGLRQSQIPGARASATATAQDNCQPMRFTLLVIFSTQLRGL